MTITLLDISLLSKGESVRQLILDTGLPLNKAPDVLGMSSSDFLDWWSSIEARSSKEVNIRQITQFFGVSEEQILTRKYDPHLLRSRIFVDPFSLPEKYSVNQFSFVRTSAHIFKYLVITRGQHFADSIAYKLNVSPQMYQNLNNRISLNYFLDLLDILEVHGFSQSELDTLSGVLFLGLAESPLFNEFKKSTTYYDCYQTLAKNLKLFDQNFVYHSELDSKQYIMKTLLPYENHNHFRWTDSQINKLNRYRQLLVGWFPYLCGLAPVIPAVSHRKKIEGIETVCTVTFPTSPVTLLSLS